MRRARRWLIALLVLGILAGASAAFYYTFVDTAYFRTEFYPDTGVVAAQRPDHPDQLTYEERAGRITLTLSRGEPHGIMTTEHEWWENLAIELPAPTSGTRIDLTSPEVRTVFWSYNWRQFPAIGEGGTRGYVQFESVGPSRIVASYHIVIDGEYPRMVPEYRHRDVVFQGQSTFRRRPRPEGEHPGHVWPKAGG